MVCPPDFRLRPRLRCVLAVAALGLAVAAPGAAWDDPAAGAPLLRVFGARELGSTSANHCTLSGRDGFVYVGNDDVRAFDGEGWQPLTVPGTYEVRCLADDEAGRLWVGGIGQIGYFQRWQDGTRQFVSLLGRLPAEQRDLGEVDAVFTQPNDTVVFVTHDRVIRLRGENTEVWPQAGGRRLIGWRDTDGTVVVAQPGTGTFRVGPHGLESAGFPEPFATAGVTWRVRFPDGSSLLGAGAELVRERAGNFNRVDGPLAVLLAPGRVTAAKALTGGIAAIATTHAGLIITNAAARPLAVLDRTAGLLTEKIQHLEVEGETGVYVTTPTEIAFFCADLKASVFDARHGLRGHRVTAIARLPAGAGPGGPAAAPGLALATDAGVGLLEAHPDGAAPLIRFLRSDPAITEPGDLLRVGDQLLGATARGVWLIDRANSAPVLTTDAEERLLAPWSAAARGVAWIEGTQFFRGVAEAGRLQPLVPPVQLPVTPTSLVEDETGAFWLGAARAGIIRVAPPGESPGRPPAPRRYATGEGRPDPAEPIRVFRAGRAILAASAAGLFVYSPAEDRFGPVPGVTNLQVHAVARVEPDGTAWLAVSQREVVPFQVRIARVRSLPGRELECELVRLPPLPFEEAPTALLAEAPAPGPERVFWLGLPGRVVRIESPGTLAANPPAAPEIAALTLIEPDNSTRPLALAGARLDYAIAGIRIDLHEPGGRGGQRVTLETRLSGIDQQWVPVGEMPARVFRGLRDRAYRFEARSVDALGRTSPPAVATFTIRPPWWRTVPAYLAYAVGLVLGSALVFIARLQIGRARQRHLEALVAERTRELAAANAAKSEFLAHITHEIRNPLNGVVGLAEMLARREDDATSRHLARSLRSCADYLGSIVDSVLDLARIETGRLELVPRRFEPRALLDSVAEIFRLQIEEAGGRLRVAVDPDLPPALIGDNHRIRQVLVNFTANALRHARGSDVRLAVRLRTRTVDEATVVFTVADTGPGIAPTEQARIFEKFARGSTSVQEHHDGHGVGLALVRSLAELLGGHATVDSIPGFGARFTLSVPLRVAAPEPPPPVPVADAVPGALRVLVVDDQAFNRLVLRDQLERLGCRVEEAGDGLSAQLLLEARAHHLAFIDLDLPGLDGLTLIARVRQSVGTSQKPFLVAISAYATRHTEESALAAGANAFLAKPLAGPRIAALVRECGDLPETPAEPACRPESRSGLFAEMDLAPGWSQQLAAEIEAELQGLRRAREQADHGAARRHVHRLASLAVIARDEVMRQQARAAEDALRLEEPDTATRLAAVEEAARARLQALRQSAAG